MDVLLMALGVYWVLKTAKLLLAAPDWVWVITTLIVSIAAVPLWGRWPAWYLALPVAAGAGLVQAVDDLLLVKADEAIVAIRRRR
jgi:hypothetical protein